MKAQKPFVLSAIWLCLFFSLSVSSVSLRGQSPGSLEWGVAVNGLQMSISMAQTLSGDAPVLQFIIRNVGENNVAVNLGIMLNNGKVQLPDRISLNVTDSNGKTRKLKFFDSKYGFIAGRVDDYIVPLRASSHYGFTISLDKFEFTSKLPSGKYQMAAQFEGAGAESVNLDMQGIGLMNFWKGTLHSNTLSFER
jgi:hypothetical protein